MQSVILLPNPKKDADFTVSGRVARILREAGIRVFLDAAFATDLDGTAEVYRAFPDEAELLLVIGGDGSVLDASVTAIERDLPILGVNLGKLGYLSEVEPCDLSVLARLATDDFSIEEKMLLTASCIRTGAKNEGEELETSPRLAVNDVVISHESYLGIADMKLTCGEEMVTYRADGMIFATPAGSTAYSLSAGGPICAHDVDAILATPICAHTLFSRPILFSPDASVSIENAGNESLHVSVDGRYFADLLPGDSCRVRKAGVSLHFLTFQKGNLFTALFRKMNKLSGMD